MKKSSQEIPFLKNLSQGQKITLLIIIIVLVFAVLYSVITLISRAGKIAVEVHFAPYAAEVKLNGTLIKNDSKQFLLPGSYELEVSFEHFTTLTKTVTIDKDHNKLLGTLSASDSEGETYIEKHKTEFTEVEGLVGVYMNEEGERIKEKYPLLTHLPSNNALYSISYNYEENDNENPVITIKSQDVYLDAAVAKLKDYGKNDNLISYKIFFSGNENPYLNPVTKSKLSDPFEFIKQSYGADQTNRIVKQGTTIDDYYVTTIQDYNFDQDLYLAHYRVVLQKSGNTWKITEYPQPFLTTHNMPGVPADVLNTGNSL